MAKIYNSTFGIISGKHGDAVAVVASNGTNYIRKYNPKKKNSNSDKQVAQRAKFAFSTAAIRPFHNLFKETMGGSDGLKRGRKHAFKNAISGTYPDFTLNYTNLMLSFGTLILPAIDIDASSETVLFTWKYVEGFNSNGDDSVNAILYNKKTGMIIHQEDLCDRESQAVEVKMPTDWEGNTCVWLYMSNGNTKSDSRLVFGF